MNIGYQNIVRIPVEEITFRNFIWGYSQEEDTYTEYHYCDTNDFHDALLIDDAWANTQTLVKQKVDVYILADELNKPEDLFLDKEYLSFSSFKSVEKKFLWVRNCTLNLEDVIDLCKVSGSIQRIKFDLINPTLTLVTSIYNNAKLLEQTIQSVINQTECSFEYIIKDACSSDGINKLIERYQKYDIRFIQKKDKGIYYGMEQGLLAANGEYLQILNSDDIYHSSGVAKKYVDILNRNNPDAICSDILMFNTDGTTRLRKADLSKLRLRACVNHTSLALKKKDFVRLGGFDKTLKIAADYDLTIKMVKAGLKIEHIEIVCVKFRACGVSNSDYTISMFWENLKCRYRYSSCNIPGYLFALLQYIKIKLKN